MQISRIFSGELTQSAACARAPRTITQKASAGPIERFTIGTPRRNYCVRGLGDHRFPRGRMQSHTALTSESTLFLTPMALTLLRRRAYSRPMLRIFTLALQQQTPSQAAVVAR